MPKLAYILLCDEVRIEANTNKLILIGLFNRFSVRDFSKALPPFTIACKITLEDSDEHTLGFQLIPPTGDPSNILTGPVQLPSESDDEERGIVVNVKVNGTLVIPSGPGRYSIAATLDDVKLGEVTFFARQKAPEES